MPRAACRGSSRRCVPRPARRTAAARPGHLVLADASRRAVGRQYAKAYLRRTNYTTSLRDLGYTDEDFADDGSDRLVDAVVAWGDVGTIVRKLRAHLDAGADHVCVQPLGPIETAADQLAALAPALGVSPA